MEEKKICKKCGRVLEIRQTKRTAEQLKKQYYYTAYYYCQHCHKLYHDDKFKVENKFSDSLFGSLNKPHSDPSAPVSLRSQGGSLTSFSPPLKGEGVRGGYDVEIWTDGACVHNGTPRAKAAWAFVSGKTEIGGRVEGKQTNNVAEGLAIYHALSWAAEKGYKRILLHTDSQISLFNLKKPASKVIANREIFEDIEKVIAVNKLEVDYKKVLGHSGDPNNERADKLANGMAGS